MMKHLFGIILFVSLFLAGSSAQEENPLWNLGSSEDYLSTPVYRYYPYSFSDYYPKFGNQTGLASFFNNDYIYTPSPYYTQPYYVSPYYTQPYWAYPFPGSSAWNLYMSRPWFIGGHSNLPKTMEIARNRSSLRVYSGGAWIPA